MPPTILNFTGFDECSEEYDIFVSFENPDGGHEVTHTYRQNKSMRDEEWDSDCVEAMMQVKDNKGWD